MTANKDLWAWIIKKDERVHGTTREKISTRFKREQPHLNALPPQPFDTSYRIFRKVYKDCTVHFEGNRYVVPHSLVGKQLILRVKDRRLRIFDNNWLIITYDIPFAKGQLVQNKAFYDALRKDKAMNRRKYHHGKKGKGKAKLTISPCRPKYDMDVEVRPISAYEQVMQEVLA